MFSLRYFDILLAVAVAVALLCFVFLYLYSKIIDGLPRNWPLVGTLPSILVNVHRIHVWCTSFLGRAGGTFLLKGPLFSNMDMLATSDPANVHYIMSGNFQNFPKGPHFRKIFDVLGDGIFNADGDSWQNQRKLAQLQIGHRRFRQFLGKNSMNKVEKGLFPILDHVSKLGLVVDLQDLFQRFTFDTTCLFVTGYDSGCLSIELPHVPFAKALDDAEETLLIRHAVPESFWKLQRWLGVGQERKYSDAWATLDQTIAKYISKKKDELREGIGIKSNEDQDGVDLLMSYLKEQDEIMGDDKFLRDTILNLMIAGRDTTSSALTWFLWLVSTHPVVEAKIREELESIIIPLPEEGGGGGKKWRLFSVEEVSKLVYLHSAICESLRLYPPVPFQHKEPLHPDILPSGHQVHPRMKVLFSLYAMGRMKFVWGEDCEEYKPERWINSKRGTIRHEPSYKFLAFNAGPRTCIGKEVAFAQIKTVAAAIIHNYRVRVVEGHPVSPNVSIILYMKHGLLVKLTKRWS